MQVMQMQASTGAGQHVGGRAAMKLKGARLFPAHEVRAQRRRIAKVLVQLPCLILAHLGLYTRTEALERLAQHAIAEFCGRTRGREGEHTQREVINHSYIDDDCWAACSSGCASQNSCKWDKINYIWWWSRPRFSDRCRYP